MRVLLLLLLLLLLCVTERKSLTDVVSTGQNTKKRGPRESFVSIERFFVFSFFFHGFLICLTLFFVFFILNEKGILVNYSYSY